MDERADEIVATYRVWKGPDLAARAEQMAMGTTAGSDGDRRGDPRQAFRALRGRVVEVDDAGPDAAIRIAYPAVSLSPQLSTVLTLVCQKLPPDGRARLEDIHLPTSFLGALPGPRNGVPGLRRRLGVPDRPLLLSTLTGASGRPTEEWEEALRAQWGGGADIVTDDGFFLGDSDAALLWRAGRAREIADRFAREEGGRRGYHPIYAFNLTAAGPDLPAQVDRLVAAGAEAFLIAPYTVGLDVLSAVTALRAAPILLAHPALSGSWVRSSGRGLAPAVGFGQLMRAAGADVAIYPSGYGPPGPSAMSSEDAAAIGRALTRPDPRQAVWPAPSAGIHPGLISALVRDVGPHVVVNAGESIHGHPGGPRAGAAAFRQALDRFLGRGGPVPDELAQALARWGGAA